MGAARRVWDAAAHPRGPDGRFISTGGAARRFILAERDAGRIDAPEAAQRLRTLAREHEAGSGRHGGLTATHLTRLADKIHVEVAAPVKPTATPTRMTKSDYTRLLKAEHVRLQILGGKTEREAKAAARPAATIDQLKERNRSLRSKLQTSGVDHRTAEQRATDDAEKSALLDEVQRLASAGGHDGAAKRAAASKMTAPELRKFVADVKEYQRRQERQTRAAQDGAAAQAAHERSRASAPASPRQVDYIMTLLSRRRRSGQGGGFFAGPTDRAGLAKLSQADASAYIDSLRDEY